MVLGTGANLFDDPDKASGCGVIAAVCRAEDGQTQIIWAGSAHRSRWCSVTDDGRCVMWPVAGFDAVILPAEGDGLGIGADQAGVRDGDPVGIAAQASTASGPPKGGLA